MKIPLWLSVSAILAAVVVPAAPQGDLRKKYVGQNSCQPELQSADNYGIRLDRTQMARLEAYRWGHNNILTIVQYKRDGEQCGVVRDIAASRDATSSFIFECRSESAPGDVLVGTWPKSQRGSSGAAVEAWKIDLKQLRFVPVKGPVRCASPSYSGTDEGDDLVSSAKKRASKR